MSCFIISEIDYKKFCDELYFITDRTSWFEDVKILYYLNQNAYNFRYREKNKIYSLDWKPTRKIHYVENPKEKLNRIIYFLESILYQINESKNLYSRGCELVGELILVAYQKTENQPNEWGEY